MNRRRSTITELPDALRDALDGLIRGGRHTIDELVDHLALLNDGEAPVSRSAVGRYKKSMEDQMQRYREAQQVARVWVDKLENEPEGDVARLLPEMMRLLAFQTIGTLNEEEDGAAPKDVMMLAAAIKDLAGADKITTERIMKIRQEAAKKAATEAVKAAKAGGLSDEAAEAIRQKILGVA